MDNASTLGVLQQLERGEIDADEADARLNTPPPLERVAAPPFDQTRLPTWFRRLWVYPLTVGILVVLFGAWVIAATVHANILWFLFGVPLVLLGALLIALAAGANSAHWIYVNVEESRKRRRTIRFGIPFPMGLLRLGLWLAQRTTSPSRARINVASARMNFNAFWEKPDELLSALERELAEGRGITVDVDDRGERVQVYIV